MPKSLEQIYKQTPHITLIKTNFSGTFGPTKLNDAGDLAQTDYEVWGIRWGDWMLLGK